MYIPAHVLRLLHHSTGALLLAVEDRDQAVSWAGRQIGHGAKTASVLAWDESLSPDWVERTGTGMQQALNIGCEPQLSFMADSVQDVKGLGREFIEIEEWYRATEESGRDSLVHCQVVTDDAGNPQGFCIAQGLFLMGNRKVHVIGKS